MSYFLESSCARCGQPIMLFSPGGNVGYEEDMDAQHCDNCNTEFYAAMQQEFPYGQCGQCGAKGESVTCEQGKQHVLFRHVEGMCGQWSDWEPVPEEVIKDGFCSYGCAPKVSKEDWYTTRDDLLPF